MKRELDSYWAHACAPRRAQSGFTLLEAIVALAILSAVLIPLYALVGNAMSSMLRARDIAGRAADELNALAALDTINPALRPQGSLQLGALQLVWHSREATPPVLGSDYPTGMSSFSVALYDLDVELRDSSGRVRSQFAARRVGWRGNQ
jgi:general secretion pathway protein I